MCSISNRAIEFSSDILLIDLERLHVQGKEPIRSSFNLKQFPSS